MYAPTFRFAGFEEVPKIAQVAIVGGLLELLVVADLAELATHPEIPPLYAAGVRYAREPEGRDEWQSVIDTLRRGDGDCEDLAAWRVAELRRGGELAARCDVVEWFAPDGSPEFHVRVRRADGSIEDPSIALGMR